MKGHGKSPYQATAVKAVAFAVWIRGSSKFIMTFSSGACVWSDCQILAWPTLDKVDLHSGDLGLNGLRSCARVMLGPIIAAKRLADDVTCSNRH